MGTAENSAINDGLQWCQSLICQTQVHG